VTRQQTPILLAVEAGQVGEQMTASMRTQQCYGIFGEIGRIGARIAMCALSGRVGQRADDKRIRPSAKTLTAQQPSGNHAVTVPLRWNYGYQL